jgi:hypothetical protein
MKRFAALISAFALLVPAVVLAQGISFGLKGGMNMSNLSGSDISNSSSRIGLVAGGFATLNLMFVKVQPEILYSQKGAKYETPSASITASYDYLEIPILLKRSFGAIVVPSIFLGPSVGLSMNAENEYIDALTGNTTIEDVKINMGPDIGLVVGAEIKTPVKLSVEARYTMGLSKIFKEESVTPSDAKNTAISVMIGYSLF